MLPLGFCTYSYVWGGFLGSRDLIPEFTRMMKPLEVLDKNMKVHDLVLLVGIRETCGSLNLCYEVFAMYEVPVSADFDLPCYGNMCR